MLDVPPSSLASQLLQGSALTTIHLYTGDPCRRWLASESGVSGTPCCSDRQQAGSYRAGGFLILRIDVIQGLVHGQFAEHDDLLDAQHGVAMRPFEESGEVTGHDTGRGEGLAGVDQ